MKPKFILSIFLTIFFACKSKPTVIQEDSPLENHATASTPATTDAPATSSAMDLHEIKVINIQHASRYTYLEADEKGQKVCIAIPLNKEIKKNQTYYFRGGILMANSEKLNFSQAYDAVRIVSVLSSTSDLSNTTNNMTDASVPGEAGVKINSVKLVPMAGVTKLSDVLSSPEKFDGKTVLVQGFVVKYNRMILNKNWIHIQDNTMDKKGNKNDLTITTMDEVQIGDPVAFEGKISLNKDFGAGYKYEVILEEAKLKK